MLNLDKDLLHHAYVIEGESDVALSELLEFFDKSLKVDIHKDPDIHINLYDTFYIEDSQIIRNLASLSSDRQIFVLSFKFITIEAQNSLLKLLEEPTKNTTFFLIVPNISILLSTVLSRLHHIKVDGVYDSKDAKKFLKMSTTDRLNFLEDIIKEKDKSSALLFLGSLERELYSIGDMYSLLSEVQIAEKYMYDRSASVKMLLEYIVVVVPKI